MTFALMVFAGLLHTKYAFVLSGRKTKLLFILNNLLLFFILTFRYLFGYNSMKIELIRHRVQDI